MAENEEEYRTRSKRPEADRPERPEREGQPDEAPEEQIDSVGDHPLGFFQVDTDNNRIEGNPLDHENIEDSIQIGTNPEAVMDQIDDYTDDQEILEDFAERQETNAGSDQLLERLIQHNSQTPEVSADDIDADWEATYQSGEESVGGTNPTPDQDVVEELGEAVGLNYSDDEELNTIDKLIERDRDRWEMDPKSADELEDVLWDEEVEQESDELDDLLDAE